MQGTSPDASSTGGTGIRTRPVGDDGVGPASGPRRVAVLSPHDSKEPKAILNTVRALGHEPVWIRDKNLSLRSKDGSLAVASQVDVPIIRLGSGPRYIAVEAADVLEAYTLDASQTVEE